eukprot:scaffold273389_cov29-Tisochrysis_lutea.AAC.6
MSRRAPWPTDGLLHTCATLHCISPRPRSPRRSSRAWGRTGMVVRPWCTPSGSERAVCNGKAACPVSVSACSFFVYSSQCRCMRSNAMSTSARSVARRRGPRWRRGPRQSTAAPILSEKESSALFNRSPEAAAKGS